MTQEPKTCLQCGKILKGRADKKFCDDYCRSNYNNQLKSCENNYVRNINNTLGKNRHILEELLPGSEEMRKITREKLLFQGFSFRYITHTYINKKGNIYFFCYDYGYLPLENNWYLIVRRRKE